MNKVLSSCDSQTFRAKFFKMAQEPNNLGEIRNNSRLYNSINTSSQTSLLPAITNSPSNMNVSPIPKNNRRDQNVSLPEMEVRHIIEKCKDEQFKTEKRPGMPPTLNEEIGVALVMNKVIQNKTLETAAKISKFSHNLPSILKIIFEEDTNRMVEQSEDEVKVLNQYENRRLNMTYNAIIQSAAKTQLKGLMKNNQVQKK